MHKQTVAQDQASLTGEPEHLRPCLCPHWSACSRSCLLVKDGLFLPVEQHVAAYCTTSHYPSCRQYQLFAGSDAQMGEYASQSINRRRSVRIPSHNNFRFSEITGSDQLPGQRDDDAWTIDLSNNGIRFATRRPLAPDTLIQFSMDADGAVAQLEGSGRVVWSEAIENTPMFHAGIAFTESPVPAFSLSIV